MADCIRNRFRNWSMVMPAIFAFVILTVSLPLLVFECGSVSALAVRMVVELEFVATVQIRRVAAHCDLVIFQITDARATSVARFGGRVAVGVGAQLRADAEDIAEDVLEEGFEGWDCGGDEACIELGADPEGYSCSVICESDEHLYVMWSM